MRFRNNPDHIKDVDSLDVHIKIVQINCGAFQNKIFKLNIRKVFFTLPFQIGCNIDIVKGHCLVNPTIVADRTWTVNKITSVVHRCNGQSFFKCCNCAFFQFATQGDDCGCNIRCINGLTKIKKVFTKFNGLVTLTFIISQIINVLDTIHFSDTNVTTKFVQQLFTDALQCGFIICVSVK